MRVLKAVRQLLLMVFCVFALAVPVLAAEEVVDQINEAINLYKQGNLSEAAAELDLAAQQIRMKQGDQMKNVFPKALEGWKADDAEANSAGGGMMGGGITTSRRYVKVVAGNPDESNGQNPAVRIDMIKDSPIMASLMMVMSNPVFMSSQQGKSVKVGSYRGMIKTEEQGASLQLIVANKVLVSVNGEGGATEAEVLAHAKGLDFALLVKLCSQ